MAYHSTQLQYGKVVQQSEECGAAQLEQKLQLAADCFQRDWSGTSICERSSVLARAAVLMRERAGDFADLITLETGKLKQHSMGEVALAANILDYYAQNGGHATSSPGVNTAAGVLFGVEPHQGTYSHIVRFAAPKLMDGNVVMVKYSPHLVLCAMAFQHLLEEAGAPQGVYTSLFISNDQVAQVTDDVRIHGLALSASDVAGAVAAAKSGHHPKKSAATDKADGVTFIGLGNSAIGPALMEAAKSEKQAFAAQYPLPSKTIQQGDNIAV